MQNQYTVDVKLKKSSETNSFQTLRQCLDWIYSNKMRWELDGLIEAVIVENDSTVFVYEWEYDLDVGAKFLAWRSR